MKRFLLALIALCVANVGKAQFYDTEVFYYIKANTELTATTVVWAFCFDGQRLVSRSMPKAEITQKFKQDQNYIDDLLKIRLDNPNYGYDYNAALSTQRTVVYSTDWTNSSQSNVSYNPNVISMPAYGTEYIAFTRDKKRMVTWRMKKADDEVLNQEYYVLVDKSWLLPKMLNVDDFFK